MGITPPSRKVWKTGAEESEGTRSPRLLVETCLTKTRDTETHPSFVFIALLLKREFTRSTRWGSHPEED